MPRTEWSFFLPAEDHKQIKKLLAAARSRLTPWGQILFSMIFVGAAISAVGTQISAFLLPSFLIALFWAAFLLSRFTRLTIEVRRHLPPPTHAGGTFAYTVTIKNTGRSPLRNISVFEPCPPFGLYDNPKHPHYNNAIPWLDAGEDTTLTLALRIPRRGTYDLKPLLAGTSFPTGILRRIRAFGPVETLTVYPRVLHPPRLPLHLQQTYQPGGITMSSSIGHSFEFASTRPYRPGDRLRDVHWPSSARTGKIIVKEYVEEYFVRVGVFIDTELRRFERHQGLESRISLAAGIADVLSEQDCVIDLFTGDRRRPRLQLGRHINQMNHVLSTLSLIEGDAQVDFSGAVDAVKDHAGQLSEMIVILKSWDEKRQHFVKKLRDMDVPVEVIIVQSHRRAVPVKAPDVTVYTIEDLKERP